MSEKRAVFFDFDETLVHADPPVLEVFLKTCCQTGLRFSKSQVQQGQRFLYEYFSGDTPSQEFLSLGPERFHLNLTRRLLNRMGAGDLCDVDVKTAGLDKAIRLPQGLTARPKIYDLLGALKQKGYVLGVISNNGGDIAARCCAFGFDEYLDFTLTRLDVGHSKPDARIFQAGLRRANVAPQQAFHIGDNYYADVLGAQNAGITPILVDPDGVFPEASCQVVPHIEALLDVFD